MSLFREKVMKNVYWLIVLGVVEFLALTSGVSIWLVSIRRQISRMNILLVQSLLQRVSQANCFVYWKRKLTFYRRSLISIQGQLVNPVLNYLREYR